MRNSGILKVGKKYKLRNGLKTGKMKRSNNGTSYKFSAVVKDPEHPTPSLLSWLPNGRYLLTGYVHKYDVIF